MKLAESDKTEAERIVEDICQKLLANPVIEEYRYELKVLSEAT